MMVLRSKQWIWGQPCPVLNLLNGESESPLVALACSIYYISLYSPHFAMFLQPGTNHQQISNLEACLILILTSPLAALAVMHCFSVPRAPLIYLAQPPGHREVEAIFLHAITSQTRRLNLQWASSSRASPWFLGEALFLIAAYGGFHSHGGTSKSLIYI